MRSVGYNLIRTAHGLSGTKQLLFRVQYPYNAGEVSLAN